MALQYVDKQNPEICEIAVKQNGLALQYIDKQTSEICEIAVKQNGMALQYVEEQTPHICHLAIEQNYNASQYVKQSHNLLQYANIKKIGICVLGFVIVSIMVTKYKNI
jgi:hypothetical protein